VKLGGATLDTATVGLGQSATPLAARLSLELFNAGASNQQMLGGAYVLGKNQFDATVFSTGTVDTTADRLFEVTVQNSNAATMSFVKRYAVLEVIE
jgi:hypothetical protein